MAVAADIGAAKWEAEWATEEGVATEIAEVADKAVAAA